MNQKKPLPPAQQRAFDDLKTIYREGLSLRQFSRVQGEYITATVQKIRAMEKAGKVKVVESSGRGGRSLRIQLIEEVA